MDKDIDVVIAWVDGNDPVHRASRLAYTENKLDNVRDDVAGETRYRQVGEINYCIASINKFAPWVRSIHIITDNQNPHVETFLEKIFPEGFIPVHIVDHKEVFRGYEKYLPTFNSRAIEAVAWRIKGLSEHYLYFNDDFLLTRPVQPEEFFDGDTSILQGYKVNTFVAKALRALRPRKNGHSKVSFRDSMLNAAEYLHAPSFIRVVHAPHPLRKSVWEKIYTEYPEMIERNVRHRFRHKEQFNTQSLYYIYALRNGLARMSGIKDSYLYLEPSGKSLLKVQRRLRRFDSVKNAHCCCFNSLDKASPEVFEEVMKWIKNKLEII